MGKKKSPENIQARNVKLLLYPDNMVHNNAIGLIAAHMIDDADGSPLPYTFLSCCHDRSQGKPHYHICVSVDQSRGGVYLGAFARSLGLVDDMGQPDLQFVRKCDGRLDSAGSFLLYLTHASAPEKERYPDTALVGDSVLLCTYGRALARYQKQEFDMSDCILACLDWIKSQRGYIIRWSAFARWICNTPFSRAASSQLVRSCIEEHNQVIYNSMRWDSLQQIQNQDLRAQTAAQMPEAAPVPDSDDLPAGLFDDIEEVI